MANSHSVTEWIKNLRGGHESAAQKLWNHFHEKLIYLVRKRMQSTQKTTGDESDVVLEVFDGCFRALKQGKYPKIDNRNDLWRLLAVIAERRAIDQIRRNTKGIDGTRANTSFTLVSDSSSVIDGIKKIACKEPTPEFAAIFEERLKKLLGLLQEREANVAILKLQRYSNGEIAEKIGRAIPTVERCLKTIRKKWENELGNLD